MKLLIIHQRPELYERMLAFCRTSDKPCFRDLEIDYYRDTNAAMAENYEAYVQRTEQNGPEWIEPDPVFLEKIADADIVMTEWGGISKRVIDAAKRLKLIATIRSAPENIEVEYANRRGIQVSISPSRLANAVADMTVGMMLSETRGLLCRNLVYTGGEWLREKYDDASHGTLCNLKIGLVDKLLGVGDIHFDLGDYYSNQKVRALTKSFLDVDKPHETYTMIQKIVMDIQSDIHYPNAYRPEENPGYQTKYGG
jgi:D-3-phosphoglycerate dehydrogenase